MRRDHAPQSHRETIMSRRLRRARGEEIDEYLDDDEFYDEDPSPAFGMRERAEYSPYAMGIGGTGCSPGVLSFLLFGVGIVAIALLFGMRIPGMSNPLDGLKSFIPGIGAVTAPTPTIRSTSTVITRIQQLSRLETTSYTMEKVIEAGVQGNVFQNLLFGDRLLLIAHGTVIAGIDLGKLQESDVTISEDGNVITIHLPPIEIFSATLDNSKTRVYDREKGLLATNNQDLETMARQTAEAGILQSACESGIMQRATNDSRRSVEQIVSVMGFERVEIAADPVPPCPSYPLNTP